MGAAETVAVARVVAKVVEAKVAVEREVQTAAARAAVAREGVMGAAERVAAARVVETVVAGMRAAEMQRR